MFGCLLRAGSVFFKGVLAQMRTNILGVQVDTLNRKETLKEVLGYILADERKCNLIATPNPEMIMLAHTDSEFAQVLNGASLVIPDGVGIVWASKYSNMRLRETVTGCDLCFKIFENIKDIEGAKAYILGAKPGVAQLAKEKMEAKFPGLNVCGARDGYFGSEDEEEIIAHINSLKPDVLLVGLSMGRQEKWVHTHRKSLEVNVAVCCGGTVDIMAGTVKRAPVLFQKLGLEWFYRLLCQPSRFFRMLVLPKFVIAVTLNRFFGGN